MSCKIESSILNFNIPWKAEGEGWVVGVGDKLNIGKCHNFIP